MKEVEQPFPHDISFSICDTTGIKKCYLRIACRAKEIRKTDTILDQAYGSTKCPNPSTMKMKYFCAIVAHNISTGLFGFASMFLSISATNIEKKAESLSKKLAAGSEEKTAISKQTR